MTDVHTCIKTNAVTEKKRVKTQIREETDPCFESNLTHSGEKKGVEPFRRKRDLLCTPAGSLSRVRCRRDDLHTFPLFDSNWIAGECVCVCVCEVLGSDVF